MRPEKIKKVKQLKAVFGIVTAVFSLAIAIQQMVHLKKGKLAKA